MVDKIDWLAFAKGLNVLDDDMFDPEEILKDMRLFKTLAFNYTDHYRKAKSDFMNGISKDMRGSKEYLRSYAEIVRICNRYGRRSFTFNTLVRSISMVQKSKEQVTRERLQSKSKPPAFDKDMRAAVTKKRIELRAELVLWLRNGSNEFVWELKSLFRKAWNRVQNEEPQTVTLVNGTTTIVQWKSFNINDILSIAFVPKSQMNGILSKLGKRLKVENCYSIDDDLVYIELDSSKIYDECGGEHLEIPDKDAKTREIYRMFPWVQVISKKIHKILDEVARQLEGNYTYKHRAWIKRIIKEEWNRTKYIIGADMTKYSDTLDRSFIMEVLEAIGMPKDVVVMINELYGMSIYDSTLVEILSDSLATYQGQYGDFPMITICNLCLQNFLYYKVGQTCLLGYNAAVGDDTGMIFDRYDPTIMDTMVDVYGCVGVNINRDKTSELVMGKGNIDFVKLEVDSIGVLEFLNMRSLNQNSIDAIVRDILDLMYVSDNKKWALTDTIFGPGSGRRLANLSIINGGINDTPIRRVDIALYVSRVQKIRSLQTVPLDETYATLERMRKYLKCEYDPCDEYYLFDTPLKAYLDEEDYKIAGSNYDKLDERLVMKVMNMSRVGLSEGTLKNYLSWIGVIPSEAREQYDRMIRGQTYDENLASIWSEINSYEVVLAYRKNSKEYKKKQISTMLPVLNGLYDEIDKVDIPESAYYPDRQVESLNEYQRVLRSYRASENTMHILKDLSGVLGLSWEQYFGNWYRYAYIKTDTGTIKRRIYDVEYRSGYEPLSKHEFESYIRPHLTDQSITLSDLLINFRESDNLRMSDWDPLKKLGYRKP